MSLPVLVPSAPLVVPFPARPAAPRAGPALREALKRILALPAAHAVAQPGPARVARRLRHQVVEALPLPTMGHAWACPHLGQKVPARQGSAAGEAPPRPDLKAQARRRIESRFYGSHRSTSRKRDTRHSYGVSSIWETACPSIIAKAYRRGNRALLFRRLPALAVSRAYSCFQYDLRAGFVFP